MFTADAITITEPAFAAFTHTSLKAESLPGLSPAGPNSHLSHPGSRPGWANIGVDKYCARALLQVEIEPHMTEILAAGEPRWGPFVGHVAGQPVADRINQLRERILDIG